MDLTHKMTYTYSHSAVRLHSTTLRDAAAMQIELSAFFLQQRVGLLWNTHTHIHTEAHAHTFGQFTNRTRLSSISLLLNRFSV